jgi:inorganic triphosphatase YgiF
MTTADVPTEVEGKLVVPTERGRRILGRLEKVGARPLRPAGVHRLHSIYVDTADFALARRGIALRLRRDAGRWEATAKWSGRVDGAVHQRPELTVPLEKRPELPFTLPDGPLRAHLTVHVMDRPLNPILVTDVHRRLSDVLPAGATDARPIAEMALDRVTLRAPQDGRALASYCELEIEGRAATPAEVSEITEQLRREHGLAHSELTKFGSGMSLLYGEGELRVEEPPAVRADDSVAIAARKIVARQLERLKEHDPGTRIGDEPELLHNARVSTRRLRAAVRAFAIAMPEQLHRALLDELRWLGRTFGAVRDLDVQLANLDQYAMPLPSAYRTALKPFRDHLDAERSRHRRELLTALDSARYFRLLGKLERFSSSRPRPERLPEPARQAIRIFAATVIEHTSERMLRRGRRLDQASSPEEMHPLRIHGKRLRYQLEFLAELTGKPGRRMVKKLIRLQDLLGALNDATVAASFICAYLDGPGKHAGASTSLAVQEFAQAGLRRSEELRRAFDKAWKRFAAKRTRKKIRAILQDLIEATSAPP